MDEVNITVIGAGVVGLAVAAALSESHRDIAVLERHDKFGQETSSRNSEVIHGGMYYPPGSLKARLCVEGRERLYDYCGRRGVAHRKLGKLVVATEEAEVAKIREIQQTGEANGVRGLALLDAGEVHGLEPAVRAVAALASPETGIIDSHALMKGLHDEAVARGVIFSFGSTVDHLSPAEGGYIVGLAEQDYRFLSRVVVNAAGLASDTVAAMAGIDVDSAGYRLRYCKGSYFAYGGKSPVSRLVYPVPHDDLAGLGVHATLDLGGRLRFGPDTEWVDSIDYDVDPGKRDGFFAGADKIIRGLDRESFQTDMAGVRPKIRGEGVKDFVIRHEAERGLEGLINLIGIESPGLTACLAIGDVVQVLVKEYLQ